MSNLSPLLLRLSFGTYIVPFQKLKTLLVDLIPCIVRVLRLREEEVASGVVVFELLKEVWRPLTMSCSASSREPANSGSR